MTVEARMLWTLSLFFFLIGVLYWATAHEPTGVTLLMLCSGAAIVAVLPYHVRRRRHGGDGAAEHHLPPTLVAVAVPHRRRGRARGQRLRPRPVAPGARRGARAAGVGRRLQPRRHPASSRARRLCGRAGVSGCGSGGPTSSRRPGASGRRRARAPSWRGRRRRGTSRGTSRRPAWRAASRRQSATQLVGDVALEVDDEAVVAEAPALVGRLSSFVEVDAPGRELLQDRDEAARLVGALEHDDRGLVVAGRRRARRPGRRPRSGSGCRGGPRCRRPAPRGRRARRRARARWRPTPARRLLAHEPRRLGGRVGGPHLDAGQVLGRKRWHCAGGHRDRERRP